MLQSTVQILMHLSSAFTDGMKISDLKLRCIAAIRCDTGPVKCRLLAAI